MHVHFIAVAGTGMGSLAGLLKSAGHRVTGSDVAFYPPMGPALERWGIEMMEGFDAAHLEPRPDLVVVGNVCRRDNPEARAAIDGGMRYMHMCDALAELMLGQTAPLVVSGTHGKTTTSSLCAWLADRAGLEPGFLIGGVPKNFERGWQRPHAGHRADSVVPQSAEGKRATPFVIEGDEYDTAFFEKTPKCWHYRPEVAIVTSIEHDHIDIYPDEASYFAAFAGFVERVDPSGLVVAFAGDEDVVRIVTEHSRAPVLWYALQGDETFAPTVHWQATPQSQGSDGQQFELHLSGESMGEFSVPMNGAHNARNAMAALAACVEGYGIPIETAREALGEFGGIKRRQDLIAEVRGIRLYDDFAHHPTAVRETLAGFRHRHPEGCLWAVYEPRTATACRALHQEAYATAFSSADRVILAPLGRTNIPDGERLDTDQLVTTLLESGLNVVAAPSIDAIVDMLVEQTVSGDTVALLSNGAFGGIHQRLSDALSTST